MKLYGTQSSKYQYFKKQLTEHLEHAGIGEEVVEINSLDQIIKDKIESIPSVITSQGTVIKCQTDKDINELLNATMETVLKENNYGTMKKILIPVDFSDISLNAFTYGLDLANSIGAHVTVVHCLHPQYGSHLVDMPSFINDQLNALVEENTHEQNYYGQSAFVETMIKERLAADGIIEMSKDFDMIVMGTKGTGNGINKWIGSISKITAKKAKCPVLLIPPSASFQGIDKIFYPLKDKMKEYDKIKWLLNSLESELHIAHFDVNEVRNPLINEILEQQTKILKAKNKWSIVYTSDNTQDVPSKILEYLHAKDIDLIILEKGKEKISEFFFSHSVTNRLTAHLESPILVLTANQRCKGCDGICCEKSTITDDYIKKEANMLSA